jgi:hypothetical protein
MLQQTWGVFCTISLTGATDADTTYEILSDTAKGLSYRVFEPCYARLVTSRAMIMWSLLALHYFRDIGLVVLQYVLYVKCILS